MRKLAIATIILALSACNSYVDSEVIEVPETVKNTVKEAVAYNLNDPEAARFRNIRQITSIRKDGSTDTVICGEVNGKNAFGAYVGFKPFAGKLRPEGFRVFAIDDGRGDILAAVSCSF